MADGEWVQVGSKGEGRINPLLSPVPLSHAEELLQTHPDIRVLRSEYRHGIVEITKRVDDRWRQIEIDVEHEEGSQRHYPTVKLLAYETPRNMSPGNKLSKEIRFSYGLATIVKVHVANDEQVTAEVGYSERERYPNDFTRQRIRLYESYSRPIPAQEIVFLARTGLEILKAYSEESFDQQRRIYGANFGVAWDHSTWACQFYDGKPGRDMDEYIASVLPRMGEIMSQDSRFSINASRTKAIYALNALNKVTDAMLPGKMPPTPKNRKEPARRTRSSGR